jgi:hypothetical protein
MGLGQGPFAEAAGFGAQLCRKTVAFTGGAGAGAVGTVDLFTVTGSVIALVIGICTEDLVSAGGGDVEVGTAALTTAMIANTTATAIDNGEIWVDATPAQIECWTTGFGCMIAGGDDIILTVGTADVTDGTLIFACFWTPLTADGNVVSA